MKGWLGTLILVLVVGVLSFIGGRWYKSQYLYEVHQRDPSIKGFGILADTADGPQQETISWMGPFSTYQIVVDAQDIEKDITIDMISGDAIEVCLVGHSQTKRYESEMLLFVGIPGEDGPCTVLTAGENITISMKDYPDMIRDRGDDMQLLIQLTTSDQTPTIAYTIE